MIPVGSLTTEKRIQLDPCLVILKYRTGVLDGQVFHREFIKLLVGLHVVSNRQEVLLAHRTDCFQLGPLTEAREAELVNACVSEGRIIDQGQADRTF